MTQSRAVQQIPLNPPASRPRVVCAFETVLGFWSVCLCLVYFMSFAFVCMWG